MIKKIGVLTSGGDAPGMNAAIRAIVRIANSKGVEVVGIMNGYKGLVNNEFKALDRVSVREIVNKGGTILGSARLPEFKNNEVQLKAKAVLQEASIDALIVIGGDGTYRGALALSSLGINCIGIPGTIDNDIVGTDYTIGFDTALSTIVECVDKLRDTSSSHHRCSIVEVMGNRCGDLAIWSAISCGAEAVITKDTGFDEEELLERLKYLDTVRKKDHAIVIVSEKITDVQELARKVSERTGFSGRATVLGHIQRGGSPTAKDRVVASQMAEMAIELAINEVYGRCIGLVNNKIISTPLSESLSKPKQHDKELLQLFYELI